MNEQEQNRSFLAFLPMIGCEMAILNFHPSTVLGTLLFVNEMV
jgi:hypothetical protein